VADKSGVALGYLVGYFLFDDLHLYPPHQLLDQLSCKYIVIFVPRHSSSYHDLLHPLQLGEQASTSTTTPLPIIMTSSSPPLGEQASTSTTTPLPLITTSLPLGERPIHRNNIRPHSPEPREIHGALVAKGIETAFLGPMSPKKFISEFFPRNDSEEVSSAFKPSLFKKLAALHAARGGRLEKMMYNPFVRTISP